MDSGSFDRIAAALGTAASRRSGIAAAVSAAFGLGAGPAAARPAPASPCGKRASSVCSKDGDCCSGVCNRSAGDSNIDGLGRCRCSRRNAPCAADKDCCSRKKQGMVCRNGVCSSPCTALGQTCNKNSVCCAGACGSAALAERAERAERAAASTCCLAVGASGCTADAHCCGGAQNLAACVAGTCAAACLPVQSPCTQADVCCSPSVCGTQVAGFGGQTRGQPKTICCIWDGECTANSQCCNSTCDGGTGRCSL